jgi:uncharacterized delta-60 repeat protein
MILLRYHSPRPRIFHIWPRAERSAVMTRKLALIALVALAAALSLLTGRSTVASEIQARAPRAGSLDLTFGAGGKVMMDFGGTEEARGVAVQADGKIVAVGSTFDWGTSQGEDFALARFNSDGSLDSGFGTAGRVRTDFGGSDFASAVAIQADGKLVVAGGRSTWGAGDPGDFALARYNPDGSLDSSFGGGGKVVTDLQGADSAAALAIQADGKIVVVGGQRYGGSSSSYDFAVARYDPNGSLDPGFAGVGYAVTPFTPNDDAANAVVVQRDGKIVAAGSAGRRTEPPFSVPDLALARYNADGTLDGSFGAAGKVVNQDPLAYAALSVSLQADGKLVVAGISIVARYSGNGSLDPSFGFRGIVFPVVSFSASIVLVQPDGKIVTAGTGFDASGSDFLVTRLNADGALDWGFGEYAGSARTDFGSQERVYAAALQSDGRIVVAGSTTWVPAGDFALARYLNSAPVRCRVPNVRGKKLAVARSAIRKAQCRVGKVRRKASQKVKRGRVVSQSPKARATLPNLGKVNLVVSRGRR